MSLKDGSHFDSFCLRIPCILRGLGYQLDAFEMASRAPGLMHSLLEPGVSRT